MTRHHAILGSDRGEAGAIARPPLYPPAQIGAALADIETPALVVDLDALEDNLRRMAEIMAGTGIRLRPHAKTHKSVEIARRQVALGAIGVCCQKVSEAEIMVHGGIGDVLVSNEVAGRGKLLRLAALARQARIGICVDHLDNVGEIAEAADAMDVDLDVLIDLDVGGGRCGVPPGDGMVRIADAVAGSARLRLAGLQAYNGSSQHIADHRERLQATGRVAEIARAAVERLEAAGFGCGIVTGAGTGTLDMALSTGAFTELQPGSYVFMDADYARIRADDGRRLDRFAHSLFILTSVMSRPPDRAVVDAGHKAASVDSGLPVPWALPGTAYERPSDEHGVLAGGALPRRGEKILLVPGHCDPTVNLHDWLVGVRGLDTAEAHVEAVWPVDARGALF